jgi:hypothetical protein
MANRKPNPMKGIPRSEWARVKAERAAAAQTVPVAPTPDRSFDPHIVRESLAPPDKKADAVFPQQRVEPDPYQFSEENIPPNLFSGDQKHLEVMGLNGSMTDPIPGYKLYWFDAKNGVRIAMAQRSGYTFVEKHEVLLNDGLEGSDDLGTHVRKIGNIFGGDTEDGKPQYMYLMKKPLWLVDKHNIQMEAVNNKYEQMLKSGQISRNNAQDRQFAGGSDVARSEHSKLPSIDIQSKLYRS